MNPKVYFHTSLYTALQHARRRPVGTYIRKLREWERLDPESFLRLCRTRLGEMLEYAKTNVPLYASGEWEAADPADISSWPVLHRESIVSHLPRLQARIIYPGAICRRSSGSSGPRLQVVYDPQAAAWSWANEYRAMLWHGLSVGVEGVMIVHDMFGTKRVSRVQDLIKNKKTLLANCITPASLDEVAAYIVRRPPKLCWGLPSAIYQVVRHAAALHGGNLPRIPYFKLGGEQVYPFQRREIQERFGGRVFAAYGCAEVGAMAAECRYGALHLLGENVHLEVMRDGSPVPPGERGDLVVTSLANRAMPLIRYQMGDQARISPEKCDCGLPHPVLLDLKRKAGEEVVDIHGNPVPASRLEAVLEQLFATTSPMLLRQVLFEQKNRYRWKVYVESTSGFDEVLASNLRGMVLNLAGGACEVEVERVSVIRKETSGKLRYFRKDSSRPASLETGRIKSIHPPPFSMDVQPRGEEFTPAN